MSQGTELTFNYQMKFGKGTGIKCNCGSSKCTGVIGKYFKWALGNDFNDINYFSRFLAFFETTKDNVRFCKIFENFLKLNLKVFLIDFSDYISSLWFAYKCVWYKELIHYLYRLKRFENLQVLRETFKSCSNSRFTINFFVTTVLLNIL